jgi:hypothetical protein
VQAVVVVDGSDAGWRRGAVGLRHDQRVLVLLDALDTSAAGFVAVLGFVGQPWLVRQPGIVGQPGLARKHQPAVRVGVVWKSVCERR